MASELRRRPTSMRVSAPAEAASPPKPPAPPAKKSGGCPVQIKSGTYYYVRKAVVILFPAYVLCCMFEVLEPPRPLVEHAWDNARTALGWGPKVFSASELLKKGVGPRPMLSILGKVFDVSKGAKHYGKGGAYRGFTGRDASRAFVSGDFTKAGLIDDVSGLDPSQCLGVQDWFDFYENDSKYKPRGFLEGRFYDAKGTPTPALAEFQRCAEEGREEKIREAAEKKLYPSCNSKWSAAEGGRVWCPDGKKVPRKFAAKAVHGADIRSGGGSGGGAAAAAGAGAGGGEDNAETSRDAAKAKGRCSCFDVAYATDNEARLLSYSGCAPDSSSCVTRPPDTPKKK